MANKIELLIFDAGHVIVDFDWNVVVNGFAERANRPNHDLVPVMRHLSKLGYEHGRISTEGFLQAINDQLQSDITLAEFRQMWIATFEENAQMAKLLQSLKLHVPRLYLLSNTNEVHWEEVQAKYNIARHFDELVLSYKVGYAKPEPEIYQHVLQLSGIPAQNCLFIDDLKTNIAAAEDLGIRSILFSGVEDLTNQLNSFGISVQLPAQHTR